MSIFLHPVLASIWALTIAARIYLSFCVRMRFKAFSVYVWASTLAGCLLFAQSARNAPEWYWYTYWVSAIALHLIAVAFVVLFAFDCLRCKPKSPESLPTYASIVMFSSAGSYVACNWIWKDVMGAIWWIEQGLNLWVAVIICIVLICAKLTHHDRLRGDLVKGFACLYSFGLIVSSVRLYCPMTKVGLWALELWTELLAVGWWIYAIRQADSLDA